MGYQSTVYIALLKIEGAAETVGAFKTLTEAHLAAREAFDQYLRLKGFDEKTMYEWVSNGSSPDGDYTYWAESTTLYL